MATRRVTTTSAGGRSTTPRRAAVGKTPVRVWSSCSVTVAVSDDPPQFIKFEHGYEAMSPSDSDVDIRRTESRIYATCEKVVDLRIKKLRRLLRQLES